MLIEECREWEKGAASTALPICWTGGLGVDM
jgi:hypothetical protein